MFKITEYLEKLEITIKRDKENLKHAPPGSPARAELNGQSKLVTMLKNDLADSPVEGRTEKSQGNASQNCPAPRDWETGSVLDAFRASGLLSPQKNQLSEE